MHTKTTEFGIVVEGDDGRVLRSRFINEEAARKWMALEAEIPGGGDADLARGLTLCGIGNNAWEVTAPGWAGFALAGDQQYAQSRLELTGAMLRRAPRPPVTGKKMELVRNVKTGKARGITLASVKALKSDLDTGISRCVGPCKCRVEPDGTCPNGWRSRMLEAGF